jgi:hypothetical protein
MLLAVLAATTPSCSAYGLPARTPAVLAVRRAPDARAMFGFGKTEEPATDPEGPVVAKGPAEPIAPLTEMEIAEREAKLTALSKKWEKREAELDYAQSIRSGWGPSPEAINGRAAMFFILVGLVTEYYTGQSLPQQVYTMLQTLSIVEVTSPARAGAPSLHCADLSPLPLAVSIPFGPRPLRSPVMRSAGNFAKVQAAKSARFACSAS